MSEGGQETEAKFYVRDLNRVRLRIHDLGGRMIQARLLETNIRFDLPDGRLRSEGRVLRLRNDTDARLTYKGASKNEEGVLSRTEIEFTVGDYQRAKDFLESLGYQAIFYYEKYRMTYELKGTLIMLDELPFGNFIEIEGDSVETIREITNLLDFEFDTAIARSYHALFDHVCRSLGRSFQALSFKDFSGVLVGPTDLGVQAADSKTI